MAYIAYYTNATGRKCVRKIGKSFGCTRAELRQEIESECGSGAKLESWAYYSDMQGCDGAFTDAWQIGGRLPEFCERREARREAFRWKTQPLDDPPLSSAPQPAPATTRARCAR